MRRRKRMSRRKSKRMFSNTAVRKHPKNRYRTMRGGVSL